MKRWPRYYVTTWDSEKQCFTPQSGVRTGPYTLFGLRNAIRTLRKCGYEGRRGDPSMLVERIDRPGFNKVQMKLRLLENRLGEFEAVLPGLRQWHERFIVPALRALEDLNR